MKKNNQIILQEGYFKIAIIFFISIFLNIFISDFLNYIGYIATFALLFIYRNPNRHMYRNDTSIISPIDGKIEAIDYVNDYQNVYIKVSLCDTHRIIAPINGNIKIKKYQNGLNLNPNSLKANFLNEQITLKIDNLKMKFISGVCNTKINIEENIQVEQGDQIGIFLDGIIVLKLKNKSKLKFAIGDKVKAGEALV